MSYYQISMLGQFGCKFYGTNMWNNKSGGVSYFVFLSIIFEIIIECESEALSNQLPL